jgi:hypothetical protein
MRVLTIQTAAALLLTLAVRSARGQDPPPIPSPSAPIPSPQAPAALERAPVMLARPPQPNPTDFANQLGIHQPLLPAPQAPVQVQPMTTATTTQTTTTSTAAWTSTTRQPMVLRWGGGPVSMATANWLMTKHTWTLGHAKAVPAASDQPLAVTYYYYPRPAPRPATTTTTVTTQTTAAAQPQPAPWSAYMAMPALEAAPPPPAVPHASGQVP